MLEQAIEQGIRSEIEASVKQATEKAKAELDKRIPEIVAGIALKVLSYVRMERRQSLVVGGYHDGQLHGNAGTMDTLQLCERPTISQLSDFRQSSELSYTFTSHNYRSLRILVGTKMFAIFVPEGQSDHETLALLLANYRPEKECVKP